MKIQADIFFIKMYEYNDFIFFSFLAIAPKKQMNIQIFVKTKELMRINIFKIHRSFVIRIFNINILIANL